MSTWGVIVPEAEEDTSKAMTNMRERAVMLVLNASGHEARSCGEHEARRA